MLAPTIYIRNYQWNEAAVQLGHDTLVMGIVNVTPDSFSDGGKYQHVEAAVAHARELVADGAHILDIGGESTRPGHAPVAEEEELRRVIPVIQAIHEDMPHIPLSIDTYKSNVARQALQAGAHIINDVWGGKRDPHILQVAVDYQCPIILMHNRESTNYEDYISDVLQDLQDVVESAIAAGISKDLIWLDPGIGFAKTGADNLKLMHHLDELVALGYPVLLGTSRKRFIRDVLELPVDDVIEGTAATVSLGIAQGCQIVRVHDVKAIARTAKMMDAMLDKNIAAPSSHC
ncbi:dihydropteroate synthase [Paenibacillus aquistagni]|uniref:dihydropteroate synthase n=1 Tax=Paenibacillus aquistagni TaxID=1852522 RepID=UPI00145AA9B6|nr:dihydropteroate synthase [Paenibacillus aquistagni]NMM55223.1 dihydropteroate synthase [Paenibacillus aquistagni]